MTTTDRKPTAAGEEALVHFVAATSGEAGAQERRETARWLEASDENRREFDRLARIAAEVDVLRPHYAAEANARPRRLARFAVAMTACTAMAATVILALPGRMVTAQPNRPETVVLWDGSRMDLDAGGVAELSRLPWPRSVTLHGGDAVFQVSHNQLFPFVVHVNGTDVTDIGTRFLIRAAEDRTLVAVFEGEVAISSSGAADAHLQAGQSVELADGTLRRVPPPDETEATAWTKGRLVFRNAPLTQVAARLSRYRDIPIVVGAPAIAGLKVSGAFTLDNQDEALRALEMVLPVVARRSSDRISLMPAPPVPPR